MQILPPALEDLIEALGLLPGVGRAQPNAMRTF